MVRMTAVGNVVIVLIVLGCGTALAISVYPGALDDFALPLIFLSLFLIPVIMIVALVTLIVLASRGSLADITVPWKRIAIGAAILLSTYVLLKFYVPRRIAFSVSKSAFQQLVFQAPKSDHQGHPLNKRLGLYYVDEYAADTRGGVYFRVYSGHDGIGPDRMSYGFVYKPNMKGTPFGAAHYKIFRLGHDWYWFRVSDDWY